MTRQEKVVIRAGARPPAPRSTGSSPSLMAAIEPQLIGDATVLLRHWEA